MSDAADRCFCFIVLFLAYQTSIEYVLELLKLLDGVFSLLSRCYGRWLLDDHMRILLGICIHLQETDGLVSFVVGDIFELDYLMTYINYWRRL